MNHTRKKAHAHHIFTVQKLHVLTDLVHVAVTSLRFWCQFRASVFEDEDQMIASQSHGTGHRWPKVKWGESKRCWMPVLSHYITCHYFEILWALTPVWGDLCGFEKHSSWHFFGWDTVEQVETVTPHRQLWWLSCLGMEPNQEVTLGLQKSSAPHPGRKHWKCPSLQWCKQTVRSSKKKGTSTIYIYRDACRI